MGSFLKWPKRKGWILLGDRKAERRNNYWKNSFSPPISRKWSKNTKPSYCFLNLNYIKVHIFWEGRKILQNLHLTFDYSTLGWVLFEKFWNFKNCLQPLKDIYPRILKVVLIFFKVNSGISAGRFKICLINPICVCSGLKSK